MGAAGEADDDQTTLGGEDAPTRLERPSRVPGSSPGDDASSGTASRSTHATPIATLHQEEIHRTRVFLRIAIGLCIAVAALVPVLGGHPTAKVVLLCGCGVALAGCIWFAVQIRDPVRYTMGRLLVACATCVVGALAAIYYFGLFSPGSVVVPFGLYFFGLAQSYRATLATLLTCMGYYALLGGGIAIGLVPDHGLIDASELGVVDRMVVLVLIEVVFVSTWLLARATRRANVIALEEHDKAVRRLAMREALLREAQHDLAHALQVGGLGRYSDELIGHWRLGKLIGRGGVGEVYDARHVDTGAEAAVKLLQPHHLDDVGHVRRFLREAKAAGQLVVPNVVRILDVGDIEASTPFIAMERLRGLDLAEQLRERRRMPLSEVIAMIAQVARGLEAAHGAGIVHRDLKPHNLFLTEDGIWKLLDFGVSKLSGSQGTLTKGHLVGTPSYMAPEQAEGGDVDPRTDIHALGVIAYRALTGRPAFAGRSVPDTLYKVVHSMPPAPDSIVSDLPVEVSHVLAVAMAKSPEVRFAHVADFVAALEFAAVRRISPDVRARAELTKWGG